MRDVRELKWGASNSRKLVPVPDSGQSQLVARCGRTRQSREGKKKNWVSGVWQTEQPTLRSHAAVTSLQCL